MPQRKLKSFIRYCRECDKLIRTTSRTNKPICIECVKPNNWGSINCGFVEYLEGERE
jgi:hypothetical protein